MRLFFIVLIFIFFGCSDDRQKVKPIKTDMVEAVYSSVVIEPEDIYVVYSNASGNIDKLFVEEGSAVKKGDLLCLIENIPVRLNEDNASLSYSLARQNVDGDANLLAEMEMELRSARLKLKNDSTTFVRTKSLFDRNIVSKSEFDQISLNYEVSRTNVATLNQKCKRFKIELKNQMQQSLNTYNASASKAKDCALRSNIDGMLYQLNKKRGEFIGMQEPFAMIGRKDAYLLSMRIDEVDIARVAIGQKVLVTLQAYKDAVFEARVSRISPKMDDKTQTFEVEATFVKAPKRLYMGLTGEGNIVIHEKKHALVIPREFLLHGNMVETSDGLTQIKVGLTNWTYVEVLSGVNEKTELLKPE
jgi:HlyD family secretion protein